MCKKQNKNGFLCPVTSGDHRSDIDNFGHKLKENDTNSSLSLSLTHTQMRAG